MLRRLIVHQTATVQCTAQVHCAASPSPCRNQLLLLSCCKPHANTHVQDIPGRTLVALAGHDQLIHVEEVLDFVQHYAAKILYHPQHSHAQLLLDAHWQQQVGERCVLARLRSIE